MKKKNETKTAPTGHYYTKSGNLVKGRLTKDAQERGARKSDPKDKMRSKTPTVTQYNPTEMNKGSITTTDSREAEQLAKKGLDVKLADKMDEQENIEYSQVELKRIAAETGKALNSALEEIGDEVTGMKVKGIESDPKGGGFKLIVDYKENNEGDQFSFYISGNELYLTDFTFDKVIGEVGVLPSGKPVINRDIIKNNLVKHFRSKYLEEKKGKDTDGDGDIDSDDYLATRDQAIKKSMKNEQEDGRAKDIEGNELLIGDIIQLNGTEKMFRIGIGPNGTVVFDEVEVVDGDYKVKEDSAQVKGGTPLFVKIIKSSRRVAPYSKDMFGPTEGMSDQEFADAKEKERLEKHPEKDKIKAVQAMMKKEKTDMKEGDVDAEMDRGDLDVGHQDDEPDMLKQYAYDTAVYAAKLYKQLNKYDQMEGKVDFPNWWQAKVIKAEDYISSAQHYLEFEEKQPALDAMALQEDNINESKGHDLAYKVIGMLRSKIFPQLNNNELYDFRMTIAGEFNLINLKEINEKFNINPEAEKTVIRFVKSLAKKYGYGESDAAFLIKQALSNLGLDEEKQPALDAMALEERVDTQTFQRIDGLTNTKYLDYLTKLAVAIYKDQLESGDPFDYRDVAEYLHTQILKALSPMKEGQKSYAEAERLYYAGYELYKDGVKANDQDMIDDAEEMRLQALNLSGLEESDLLPYDMIKEAKEATCCHRCGRKHVKGTACKKPYLKKSDPRHCANK